MNKLIKINYVNDTESSDTPKVFLCMKDMPPASSPENNSINTDLEQKISDGIIDFGKIHTSVLHPKLYWGLASEIQESKQKDFTGSNSNNFFELDLEELSEITVTLHGNAEDGYHTHQKQHKKILGHYLKICLNMSVV